jgi:alkylation response protein AidB-like acyl-CoA dehydrogenase
LTVDTERESLVAELRTTVRGVCDSLGGLACARTSIDTGQQDVGDKAWKLLAEQVGVAALGLPEEQGGIGGLPELLAVSAELGASLLPVPFFSSTVLAGQVLARCSASAHSTVEALARGEVAAVAALGADGVFDRSRAPFRMGPGGRVSGHCAAVIGAKQARWLVLATADALCVVDARAPECRLDAAALLDPTRPAGAVTVTDAPCRVVSDDPAAVLRPALDVAALVLAAEQIGGAQACLDMTVAYVKERTQFSRPIGSFQAVKHTLADALLKIEIGRSALTRVVDGSTPETPTELGEAAAVARIWCNEAYRFVTAEAIQLHGGIGFTWEHDAHLYFRRARADAVILGSTAQWRERLAATLNW